MIAPAEQDALIPPPVNFPRPGAVEPRQLPPLDRLTRPQIVSTSADTLLSVTSAGTLLSVTSADTLLSVTSADTLLSVTSADTTADRVEAYLAEGEKMGGEAPQAGGLTAEQVKEFTTKYPWMSGASLRELEALFLDWDEDGSGEISCDEMGEMLSKVVRDLFADLDVDHSGTLGKKEIQSLCHRLGLSVSTAEVAKWVEDMKVDSETPGQEISFCDFQRWWNGFEDGEVSAEELQDLFDEVDEDGSGQVDIEEFINMIAMKMEGKNLEGKGMYNPGLMFS